eukprot:scaffold15956_cov32-Cyclotella_meneghiniana.AAC.3
MDVQFWPKVGYCLCCNIATQAQLEKCLSKQYYDIISKGRVISSTPAAIRQLGEGFYGVGSTAAPPVMAPRCIFLYTKPDN